MGELKVAYDISVLGIAYGNERAKTGVCRVVEQVAAGLAASPSCDLAWCVTQGEMSHLEGSRKYVRGIPSLSKVPFIESRGFAVTAYRASRKAHMALDRSPIRFNLGLRAASKVLRKADSAARTASTAMLTTALDNFDIYHSPFHEIPADIRANRKVRKFLTVYDLIPIIHPEFFGAYDRNENVKKFATVDKDHWLLCISEATRADLCKICNVDPAKVIVTPLAADPTNFYHCTDAARTAAVLKKYAIPAAPYILSLATLEPRKNIRHVIDNFVRLVTQQRDLDLNLVLAGTRGWLFDEIFASIDAAGDAARRIFVTGRIADEDLAPVYSAASVFVYPSHYEGFGLPPLEAMQCGLPVVTSNNSSLPEVVGDAGIMIDANDGDALCQSIMNITRNPSLRATLSVRGIERAKSFSWDHCVRKTIEAYRSSLS